MSDSQQFGEESSPSVPPVTETLPPRLRRYSTAFKLRIIEEADACVEPGALSSLLRREGIYFSTLKDFRKQKARGDFNAVAASYKSRNGSKSKPQEAKDDGQGSQGKSRSVRSEASALGVAESDSLAAAEREIRRLRRELARANALLDLQKKVSELMGFSLEDPE